MISTLHTKLLCSAKISFGATWMNCLSGRPLSRRSCLFKIGVLTRANNMFRVYLQKPSKQCRRRHSVCFAGSQIYTAPEQAAHSGFPLYAHIFFTLTHPSSSCRCRAFVAWPIYLWYSKYIIFWNEVKLMCLFDNHSTNSSIIISVLALLVSLTNTIYLLWMERRKISLPDRRKLTAYFWKDEFNLELTFVNKSKIPMSITDVELVIQEKCFLAKRKCFFAKKNEHYIASFDNGSLPERIFSSQKIPVTLSPYSSHRGYYRFKINSDDVKGKCVSLYLHTSRGKVKKHRLTIIPADAAQILRD